MQRFGREPNVTSLEFPPAPLCEEEERPATVPRYFLYGILSLLTASLVWAIIGRLDVVAVAHGKLVPDGFLKIVQPAEHGIVREILVKDGEVVDAGQVLMRMDKRISTADLNVVRNELQLRDLQLRRIDAELKGGSIRKLADDNSEVYAQMEAQLDTRRRSHSTLLENENANLKKAKEDLAAAYEVEVKLKNLMPIYRDQAEGWERLAREGFAGRLMVLDRKRSVIETEQDLRTQAHVIQSLKALVEQSEKRISQIAFDYRQQLQNERIEAGVHYRRLREELDKQQHRHSLTELKAPQNGVVKDLATHTVGTVVSPGAILLTLVPRDKPLQAEIWVSNADVGFVYPDQPVKLKLSAFPFQKYGMLDGAIRRISADATDQKDIGACGARFTGDALRYRALVELASPVLERNGRRFIPTPGMELTAEINLGTRTVMEYLLSPLQKVAHEAARER